MIFLPYKIQLSLQNRRQGTEDQPALGRSIDEAVKGQQISENAFSQYTVFGAFDPLGPVADVNRNAIEIRGTP